MYHKGVLTPRSRHPWLARKLSYTDPPAAQIACHSQAATMFWRLGYAHTSPIETILDGNDYTLQQVRPLRRSKSPFCQSYAAGCSHFVVARHLTRVRGTPDQLLDEEDLVQECKQMNRRLVDYLGLPEQVEALVGYLVTETAPDADEKVKFVYPYKASEVLSQDLTPVYDTLFASEVAAQPRPSCVPRSAPRAFCPAPDPRTSSVLQPSPPRAAGASCKTPRLPGKPRCLSA